MINFGLTLRAGANPTPGKHPAALVDGCRADPRAIAGRDFPEIGELRTGAVTLNQPGNAEPAGVKAPRTGYLQTNTPYLLAA
jgi:hypothetical protein